jgi:AcrR family transcriptional regulator
MSRPVGVEVFSVLASKASIGFEKSDETKPQGPQSPRILCCMPRVSNQSQPETAVNPARPGSPDGSPKTSVNEAVPAAIASKTQPKVSKSERTEAAIVDAALDLFADQGYESTTMRQIAQRAGVSVGNSYYYFASKEALVQALYERFSFATFDAALNRISKLDTLADRIAEAMLTWVDVMAPNRKFGAAFFKSATDFGSSVSPFSTESAHIRKQSYGLWQAVLDGATDTEDLGSVDPATAERLPQLLWLYALAIVAAWSQDPTPTSERTVRLIHRSAPFIAQIVKLAHNSMFTSAAEQLMGLLDEIASLRDPIEPAAELA